MSDICLKCKLFMFCNITDISEMMSVAMAWEFSVYYLPPKDYCMID